MTAQQTVKFAPCRYLQCALTGKVFASRFVGSGSREWDWIAHSVAEWVGCDPDEVDAIETEDGQDCFTVKGEVVARSEVSP